MNIDKDYFEMMRMKYEWTEKEKLLWEYLSHICEMLYEMKEMKMEKKDPLMGMYKIQPQSGKGYPKGPPTSHLN